MKIYAYNKASESAKNLAKVLGVKRLKQNGKKVKGLIINWGASAIPREYEKVINSPDAVARASNKLSAMEILGLFDVAVPFTQDIEEAKEWIDEGATVVCRTLLNSHSGKGIVLASSKEELVKCQLYTRYIKKNFEYRLHVHLGEVFFIQQKQRKLDVPDDKVNWQIRNHQNGFIYANKNIVLDDQIKKYAKHAVLRLGLDFGAVDIIVTKAGLPYVLEVNTAPGLSGATLEAYKQEFSI